MGMIAAFLTDNEVKTTMNERVFLFSRTHS